MNTADLKQVVERTPFRPFALRTDGGAEYRFTSPRELGATQACNMVFHIGEHNATRIDADSVVEVIDGK